MAFTCTVLHIRNKELVARLYDSRIIQKQRPTLDERSRRFPRILRAAGSSLTRGTCLQMSSFADPLQHLRPAAPSGINFND